MALFGSLGQSPHVLCFKNQQCWQRSHLFGCLAYDTSFAHYCLIDLIINLFDFVFVFVFNFMHMKQVGYDDH